MKKITRTSRRAPMEQVEKEYSFEVFSDSTVFPGKRTGRLPAMGWNSWNAFGSANTEALTIAQIERIKALGLDELGYSYVILDDGCYYPERVDGKLVNEAVKFPSGFRALADRCHEAGLKFGMYNDVGVRLCAGSEVGTCGFEDTDAQSYVDWGVDFLKIDNCYYLWDNATFSDPENARFSHAPNISAVRIRGNGTELLLDAVKDGVLRGNGASKVEDVNAAAAVRYVTGIGTLDGTNVGTTPVGARSSELAFDIEVPVDGAYEVTVCYATDRVPGCGAWLQLAVGEGADCERFLDALLPETGGPQCFTEAAPVTVHLSKGKNLLRLMNHRRQENALISYAAMFNALQAAAPGNDIVLSLCEWGKNQPQNFGFKIGDSWRILNDISFNVGSPEKNGACVWTAPGTNSITSQYDKCVVMDEFAGLDRGWNDPDMMVVGMDGITPVMASTHMVMWCMMNSPLMLGIDLRKVEKGDEIYRIIANRELIALNQDPLGVQAKRVYCSLIEQAPDKTYVTNHDRVDILAKPLANGDIAVSFINVGEKAVGRQEISLETITSMIGPKMADRAAFESASSYTVKDLLTGETGALCGRTLTVSGIEGCGSYTVRVSAN